MSKISTKIPGSSGVKVRDMKFITSTVAFENLLNCENHKILVSTAAFNADHFQIQPPFAFA